MENKEKQINVSTKEEIEERNKKGKEKDELRQALLHYATAEASGGIKSLIDCEGCAFYLYEILGYRKNLEDSVAYKDGKIYYNGKHIGYIDFSFYDDIKALGFGNFEIIDKRKGYGTIVIKDIITKLKDKYDLIYCFVDKENSGAIEFYKKVGKVCFDIINDKGQYQVILHRKEDSIVLSREEYEEYQKFKSFMERNDWESIEDIETTLDKCQEVLYERLQQERKETAEKILNEIDCIPTNEVNELNHLRLLKMNIAKQYGIEIKE